MSVLIILSRWLHVMAAILAIGATFFMRVILPIGLSQADDATRQAVFLKCRRIFKMLIHTCILLLILTGTFNTLRNWDDYNLRKGIMHGLWGMHVVLGLTAIVISLLLLGPKEPPKWHRTGAAVNLVILFIVVALASSVKYVRDTAVKSGSTTQPSQVK